MPAFENLMNALGWSLLESIWQMALLWLVFIIATGNRLRFSSSEKHGLAVLFVIIGSSWFVYSFVDLLFTPRNLMGNGFIPVFFPIEKGMPYLTCFYINLLFIRLIRGRNSRVEYGHKISGTAAPLLQHFAEGQARIMGISRKIGVFISECIETAQTSGYLKPVILLPAAMVTKLSSLQLEAIITHELFHIRRNDYLIQMGMSCFRTIFFFNPFALLFYRTISMERELACDDGVLGMSFAPELYAEALFNLEKLRQIDRSFALAADGNRPWLLMERIRRVLGEPVVAKNHFKPWMVALALGMIFLMGVRQNPPVHKVWQDWTTIGSPASLQNEKTIVEPVQNVSERERMPVQKHHKHFITPGEKGIAVRTENESGHLIFPDSADPGSASQVARLYFADNHIIRDYSNQPSAGPTTVYIPSFPGTPYIPSVSFTYEGLPEITSDSSRESDMLADMKKQVQLAHEEAVVSLRKLQTQYDKNKREFRSMELKNKKRIESREKNLNPILEKIKIDLQLKKQEIDRIRNTIQVTDEEIIHI